MSLVVSGALGQSFRKGVNEQAYQRAMWQHRKIQERNQKTQSNVTHGDTDSVTDFAASVVSIEQLEQLQSEIDIYQTATVEVLQLNERALELAREQLANTLSNAHVLEDGRRVFKTEDGLRVFDEHGSELTLETISPDDIADERPRWEQFLLERDKVIDLEREQSQLLEFQSELDEAQERLDSGEMTQGEYDRLHDDIYASAPDAVRELASQRGLEFDNEKDAENSAPSQTLDINLDSELAALPHPSFGATQKLGG